MQLVWYPTAVQVVLITIFPVHGDKPLPAQLGLGLVFCLLLVWLLLQALCLARG